MTHSFDHTIVALSTPPGESGIAVVRMSGPDALDILRRVYRSAAGTVHEGGWEHRRLYYGRLSDCGEETIDDVMCAVMLAPESYTGEDVVEISCHGGALIVRRVLQALESMGARPAEPGARPAEPGEFTKRAFLNGKMDLIQAEAVADLIHARSELQRQVAHAQLSGGLSQRIGELADQIVELLGIIEANIDFIEEDIDTFDTARALELLDAHRDEVGKLLESGALSRPFHEGFQVAIAGPVNTGKSSLFNRLVGSGRAIVTDIPGTTRDVLREPLVLEGLVFVFHDTAGLRGSADNPVESIGIERAHGTVAGADLVLFVVDASQPPRAESHAMLGGLDPQRTIVVCNKIDLGADNGLEFGAEYSRAQVSALTGDGLDGLKEAIVAKAGGEQLELVVRERIVLSARLEALLDSACRKIDTLRESIKHKHPLEILAVEAREVLAEFEAATGRRYQDDILDGIFSRFCIGK